jgi:hypothetical protein
MGSDWDDSGRYIAPERPAMLITLPDGLLQSPVAEDILRTVNLLMMVIGIHVLPPFFTYC